MPCDRSCGPGLHALLLVHDSQSQSPQQTPADLIGITIPAAETAAAAADMAAKAAAAAASHLTISANSSLCTALAAARVKTEFKHWCNGGASLPCLL